MPWLGAEFSRGTLLWAAAGAALMGATMGILVAAYFDGIAAIIVETVTAKKQRSRVRTLSTWAWLLYQSDGHLPSKASTWDRTIVDWTPELSQCCTCSGCQTQQGASCSPRRPDMSE